MTQKWAKKLESGDIFASKYRIIKRLDEGGMGVVYEAEHLRLARRVAIKMLKGPIATSSEFLERFEAEARRVANVRHPNILAVHDFEEDEEGRPYLETELLHGESLEGVLPKTGPFELEEAVSVLKELLLALEAAHLSGIIHRDIKPANVFITNTSLGAPGPGVKLIDFGIAKAIDELDLRMTPPGVVLGTPLYMSPEQASDPANVDQRTDLYSAGAVFFKMLTGRSPMRAASTLEAIARAGEGRVQRRPSTARAGLPLWVDAFVERAMAVDRNERFGSAREMLNGLDAGTLREPASPTVPITPPRPKRRLLPAAFATAAAGLAAAGLAPSALRSCSNDPLVVAIESPPPPGMVRMAGGTLQIGSSDEDIEKAMALCQAFSGNQCRRELYEREQPQHPVTVRPFYLDAREVTQGDFAAWLKTVPVMARQDGTLTSGGTPLLSLYPGINGIRFEASGISVTEERECHPAVQVTWKGAQSFCESQGKRLPTEAEWAFAARGIEGRRYAWGNDEPSCSGVTFGRTNGGPCARSPAGKDRPSDGPRSLGPRPVGTSPKDVTPEGVYDLSGNVAEWTSDTFRASYRPDAPPKAPSSNGGPLKSSHTIRGGYFDGGPESLRAAGRARLGEGDLATNVGFRCAQDLKDNELSRRGDGHGVTGDGPRNERARR